MNSCVYAAPLKNDNSDYNNAAWFYDALAHIVFGKTINKSQTCFLETIIPGSSILIVGGGTGWILDEITRQQSCGLQIVFVEKSSKMIKTARKRLTGSNQVIFIHEAIENSLLDKSFDMVITSFLFDSFSISTINTVFKRLEAKLRPGGIWLYSDFLASKKLWHKLLLNIMYFFFKVVCNIEADNLPDLDLQFKKYDLDLINEKRFYGNFITGRIYMKRLTNGIQHINK